MKIRESGMPEEQMWSAFFNVELILDELQIDESVTNLIEIGCGYGTFTVAAAKRINGIMMSFDIDADMITAALEKVEQAQLNNIVIMQKDILANQEKYELPVADYFMLFNILHHENPIALLQQASDAIHPKGRIGIIHWRSDIETPRGPNLSIRPTPEQCIEWAKQCSLTIYKKPFLLPPYHYGLILQKP